MLHIDVFNAADSRDLGAMQMMLETFEPSQILFLSTAAGRDSSGGFAHWVTIIWRDAKSEDK